VLVAPHFPLRIKAEPTLANPPAIHSIKDSELPSRLSYFLWRSIRTRSCSALRKENAALPECSERTLTTEARAFPAEPP
jgi:hypothetical protein